MKKTVPHLNGLYIGLTESDRYAYINKVIPTGQYQINRYSHSKLNEHTKENSALQISNRLRCFVSRLSFLERKTA